MARAGANPRPTSPGARRWWPTSAPPGSASPSATICASRSFSAPRRWRGAEVLTVPAAFTRQTGEAHWHILLRARAIENGAFVIAAAQGGQHEDGRETFGHSLIVDPWGRILAEADHDEPGVIVAEIDTAAVGGRAPENPQPQECAREFALGSVAAAPVAFRERRAG
ncbi:MAG: hypothetical protein NVV72_11405 [Asticcacaulis sp.]|nr:hypothetical protein [Asticcacaulis sp.]